LSAKLTSVSVDIDEVHHYFAIHGLPEPSSASLHAAYDVALGRMADFAASRSIPLTLFVVGADLARAESSAALATFARRGHAIENHSLSHRYDLTRLDRATIAREVEEGARAIERVTGRRPEGFRAPGYTVSDALFDALDELGVAFDSSVFPCPPYYLAKAAAMAGMRVRGRVSRSILDTPRVLAAPRRPYRPGARWFQRGARRFVELPVQVTPHLGLPFIGTAIALGGPTIAAYLASRCAGEPLVNLELHAMDFLDAGDGLDALVGHQPELSVPLARRIDALSAALDALAARGHAFVTLAEAARAFA
jgi:peptidoglycan/xylan/chitin deacetylase (PgdA/CDA1 family)